MSAQPQPVPGAIVIRRVRFDRTYRGLGWVWLYYVTTAGNFTGCGTQREAEEMAARRQQDTGLEIMRLYLHC